MKLVGLILATGQTDALVWNEVYQRGAGHMASILETDAFIDGYCRAFVSGCGNDIGQFYNVPCLTVRGDGSLHVFTSESEVAGFFQNVVDTYRDEGMRGFACESPSVISLGTACVSLSCGWVMQRADGSAIRRWHQTYVLKDTFGVWKIIAAILHVP